MGTANLGSEVVVLLLGTGTKKLGMSFSTNESRLVTNAFFRAEVLNMDVNLDVLLEVVGLNNCCFRDFSCTSVSNCKLKAKLLKLVLSWPSCVLRLCIENGDLKSSSTRRF